MLNLKNHPFAVEAYFEKSMVLTYSFPKEQLEPLIPKCLELDSFQDKYAFIAVALVQTKSLRPKGFPDFMGNDFALIGYRIFVRYTDSRGKRLRGLYILKSETDKKKMEFFGNIFTHYNYGTTDILIQTNELETEIHSQKSKIEIKLKQLGLQSKLPENSPFADWKEARRFAGPMPFTFTYDESKKEVLIIEGVRNNWKPEPMEVTSESVGFFEERNLNNGILSNAFIVEKIPYYWKKGKIEKWKA